MDYVMLVAGALGIGPALGLMFLTFADYTYPKVDRPFFDDRKVFGMLTVGLILGVIMATFRLFFNMGDPLIAIMYAVFVLAVMLVILMLKRFALRLDTAFYGMSLGLGIGATMAFSLTYRSLSALIDEGSSIEGYALIVAWSFQLVLINAVAGAIIGIGSSKGRPWSYFGRALLIQAAYYLMLLPLYNGMDEIIVFVTFILATVFAFYTYWYIHRKAIPDVVADALSRMKKAKKKVKAKEAP
ncbi:MAG: hypothetical protein LLG16_08455 [Euryarchaeota archaeon]|nr:hypothetical protein [Euryarchaeota archaeon]